MEARDRDNLRFSVGATRHYFCELSDFWPDNLTMPDEPSTARIGIAYNLFLAATFVSLPRANAINGQNLSSAGDCPSPGRR